VAAIAREIQTHAAVEAGGFAQRTGRQRLPGRASCARPDSSSSWATMIDPPTFMEPSAAAAVLVRTLTPTPRGTTVADASVASGRPGARQWAAGAVTS
jgi:hypothetical protein